MKEIKLIIYNSYKKLFKGKIKMLSAPGLNGYFQIFYNHITFFSVLKNGILFFKEKKKEEIVVRKINIYGGGIVRVKENIITIFIV